MKEGRPVRHTNIYIHTHEFSFSSWYFTFVCVSFLCVWKGPCSWRFSTVSYYFLVLFASRSLFFSCSMLSLYLLQFFECICVCIQCRYYIWVTICICGNQHSHDGKNGIEGKKRRNWKADVGCFFSL